MRGSAKSPEQLQAEQQARDEAAKKILEEQANREQVTLVGARGLSSGGGAIGPGVTKGGMFGGGGNPLPRSGDGLTIGQQYYVDTDKKGRRYIQLPGEMGGPGERAYWNDKVGAFRSLGGGKHGNSGPKILYTSSVLPSSTTSSDSAGGSSGSSSSSSSGGPLSKSAAEDQMAFHKAQQDAYFSDPDKPLDESALLPVAKVRIPVSVL